MPICHAVSPSCASPIEHSGANVQSGTVLRRRGIAKTLMPSLFVAHVGKVCKNRALAAELLVANGLCTLEHLIARKPLSEVSASFLASCIVVRSAPLFAVAACAGLSAHKMRAGPS